ncbi:Oxidoreductase-like, N-terminal, partial [Parasponia andersonii]
KKITITSRSQQTRLLGIRTQNTPMADEAPTNEAAKKPLDTAPPPPAAAGSEKTPPPPPPEKPLPGDCCGSGCVRCVWDVYYEELEEYNKLHKTDSGSNSKPS